MKSSVVGDKSYEFVLKIIVLYKELTSDKKEFILLKQLIRSGTSIGANTEEAIGGQSTADFISKISISHKEQSLPPMNDCEELLKIMTTIQKTTKTNLSTN